MNENKQGANSGRKRTILSIDMVNRIDSTEREGDQEQKEIKHTHTHIIDLTCYVH